MSYTVFVELTATPNFRLRQIILAAKKENIPATYIARESGEQRGWLTAVARERSKIPLNPHNLRHRASVARICALLGRDPTEVWGEQLEAPPTSHLDLLLDIIEDTASDGRRRSAARSAIRELFLARVA